MATLRLVIPFAVGVLVYSGCLEGAHWTFQQTWFQEFGPGEPPWYFVGYDAIKALWSASGAIALVVFAATTARWLPAVWFATGVALISFSGPIGQGVNIAMHTAHIWERSRAGMDWPNVDAYLRSHETAHYKSPGVIIALLVVGAVRGRAWELGTRG